MSTRLVTFSIGANPPGRLDKALARDVPEEAALSRSRLAKLLEAGAVRLDGAECRDAKARPAEGQSVEIAVEEAQDSHILPEEIPLTVVYEDDELIVVDKPVGMVVHPAPGTPSGTLVNALMAHCGDSLSGVGGMKRPGVVHRIDKDTSGLLVAAKTDRAHHALAAQFAAHSVDRLYRAICHGVPDPADPRLVGTRGVSTEAGGVIRITTGLARHRTDRQRQAVYFEAGKHAVTRLRVVESFGAPATAAALVDCWLETGRTHQIRVHMSHIGHGLVGDPVYGRRRRLSETALGPVAVAAADGFGRQALHAARLGFEHPVSGEHLSFESPLPADMSRLADLLRQRPDEV